jgi:hypothetical protein
MKYEDSHPSDQELLLSVEGELSSPGQAAVQSHLAACWKCRARRLEFENAIADFIQVRQTELDPYLPPAEGPRALLKAQLAQERAAARPTWFRPMRRVKPAAAALVPAVAVLILLLANSFAIRRSRAISPTVFSIPNTTLTPGAAVLTSRQAVCSQANIKNKAVPVALRERVFEEYGISRAEPRAYEVDYLVTPALGGADDVRNLWPHSYSATVWNARVKDELEDRLRNMVCDGSLDLRVAQTEIASNWIAAYKKYFHTDQPLDER